jgi:hypothetical protein
MHSGGAIYKLTEAQFLVSNCTFTSNGRPARSGGAVACAGPFNFTDTVFTGNSAETGQCQSSSYTS